jgi:hypothetical protein
MNAQDFFGNEINVGDTVAFMQIDERRGHQDHRKDGFHQP